MVRHCDVGETNLAEIRHYLDASWSGFVIGDRRFEIRRDDLYSIRAYREFAQALSAQAHMWEMELASLEEAAIAAEAAPQTPEPLSDPTAAPDPTPAAEVPDDTGDEPFGGDDPELDKHVARVVAMPEGHRKGAKEEL